MEEKITALEKFLEGEGESIVAIDATAYDENNTFEVELTDDTREYLVATDDEADDICKDQIIMLLDDMGIEALAPDYDWTPFVEDDWFESAFREMHESYCEDIKMEDDYSDTYANRLIEELVNDKCLDETELVENEDGLLDCDDLDDAIEKFIEDYLTDGYEYYGSYAEWYQNEFGDRDFDKVCKDNDLFDYDAIADNVMDIDGRGNTIAGYDGEEHEQLVNNQWYYIYRTN